MFLVVIVALLAAFVYLGIAFMYKDFFSLKESPFSIIPSARFLYLSERHREALNHMVAGLSDGGGFALLTGEVGTGKTTVLRALIARLEENTQVATILNPSLSSAELLESLCDELALSYPASPTMKQLTDTVFAKLKENEASGKQTVLIVDEAQHLMPDVLEQLRLLTNLENESRKLLKVVLIGQPELQRLLQQDNLRQLAQRITSRYHLLPLTEPEVANYIRYRLQAVDCLDAIFTTKSMTVVSKRTLGIPRLINLVCDKSMQIACQQGRMNVTPEMVSQACDHVLDWQNITLDVEPRSKAPLAITIALAFAITGVVAYKSLPWDKSTVAGMAMEESALLNDVVRTPALSVSMARPAESIAEPEEEEVKAQQTIVLPDDIWHLAGDERQGLRTLAKLWGIALSYPQTNCALLASGPMQCYQSEVTLPELRMLDKPAVITLYGDVNSLSAVVYAIDETQVELLIDGYKAVVTHEWLQQHWLGEALWLWKPPFSDTVILPEQSGEPVRWLDQRLALVLGDRQLNTRTLNGAMSERVARFQRNQLLDADGIPGPMTLMSLQSALRLSGPDLMPVDRNVGRIEDDYQLMPHPQLVEGTPLLLTAPPESELTAPVRAQSVRESEAPVVVVSTTEEVGTRVRASNYTDSEPMAFDLSELSPDLALRVQAALAGDTVETSSNSEGIAAQGENHQEASSALIPIGHLPLEVQNRIPPLNFQTHIYASTARARWVKVNNRELFEGDEVSPGLVLETIAPNHVEMGFEDYRFMLPALSEW